VKGRKPPPKRGDAKPHPKQKEVLGTTQENHNVNAAVGSAIQLTNVQLAVPLVTSATEEAVSVPSASPRR